MYTPIAFMATGYHGNFIDKFTFWDDSQRTDPTGTSQDPSAANFVSSASAQQRGLVAVNDQGNFVLSSDSTSRLDGNARRPSVRIQSTDSIHHGLLILDAAHLPYGNTSWPSFWLSGADGNWPYSGEIDIYEGVNFNTRNTMSYHTSDGCSYDTSVKQTGNLAPVGTNCNALANNDEACGNLDPSTTSFGSGANSNGGSYYAMEWTSDHIKMWHFNRAYAPSDIASGEPNPADWPTPVTYLASTNCDIDSHFLDQVIIFAVEICGTWAGAVFPGGPYDCIQYAQQNPEAFGSAYFEVRSLSYYQ
ncbi:beta-1,3-1,4-glucanase [Hysterangium stoloniferum]|nr:beta-1,3-1,4-glucanase [Hysterangium stoloniferum]